MEFLSNHVSNHKGKLNTQVLEVLIPYANTKMSTFVSLQRGKKKKQQNYYEQRERLISKELRWSSQLRVCLTDGDQLQNTLLNMQ